MSVFDALVQAGMIRFRPVVLTAITTILGLIPMAVGAALNQLHHVGAHSRTLRSVVARRTKRRLVGAMAIAVIFGLAFATILTLVMVPLYSIFDDLSGLLKRFGKAPVAATAIALLCMLVGAPHAPG